MFNLELNTQCNIYVTWKMYHKRPMCHICNITDLSQGGVVFQKQLQKHVISGPFGLFYMPHNFPIRRNWSGFLWVNKGCGLLEQFRQKYIKVLMVLCTGEFTQGLCWSHHKQRDTHTPPLKLINLCFNKRHELCDHNGCVGLKMKQYFVLFWSKQLTRADVSFFLFRNSGQAAKYYSLACYSPLLQPLCFLGKQE